MASAEADSFFLNFQLPGIPVSGFHMPPLARLGLAAPKCISIVFTELKSHAGDPNAALKRLSPNLLV